LSVRGYEAGTDVGGTWYWNRYPGCRLDTESYAYGYFGLNGIVPEWQWSERFAGQAELLRYVNHAADHMDIRRNYQFRTKVKRAAYDEGANLWRLQFDDGTSASCRFLLSAVVRYPRRACPTFRALSHSVASRFIRRAGLATRAATAACTTSVASAWA
jgi:cyclohexanone monooxygenase